MQKSMKPRKLRLLSTYELKTITGGNNGSGNKGGEEIPPEPQQIWGS